MYKMRVVVCAAGVAASMSARADPVWSYYAGGDIGYNALTNGGALEQGVVEGRIGNRVDIGTWEMGIWRFHDVGPFLAQGQLPWFNGVGAPFSIVYDGATTVTYTMGSTTISTTQLGGTFTDIFLRTRSATFGDVDLRSLQLIGAGTLAVGPLASTGAADVDYIRIENGGQAFGAFELRGVQTLTWLSTEPPINSQVNAQFRLTNVPAPASMVALLPLIACGRRRR